MKVFVKKNSVLYAAFSILLNVRFLDNGFFSYLEIAWKVKQLKQLRNENKVPWHARKSAFNPLLHNSAFWHLWNIIFKYIIENGAEEQMLHFP